MREEGGCGERRDGWGRESCVGRFMTLPSRLGKIRMARVSVNLMPRIYRDAGATEFLQKLHEHGNNYRQKKVLCWMCGSDKAETCSVTDC